jgi:hypothetical protein
MSPQQASVMNGLNTDLCIIQAAGMYSITTRTNMVQPSGLVVTISQSGSMSKTFVSPTVSAQSEDIEVTGQFNCAVGDVISVVVSSSAPEDKPPSLVKTTVNLRQGI